MFEHCKKAVSRYSPVHEPLMDHGGDQDLHLVVAGMVGTFYFSATEYTVPPSLLSARPSVSRVPSVKTSWRTGWKGSVLAVLDFGLAS
ncbi:hypothetical protein R1flu_028388 [Riccia fluitans]|uniref:Uncharacterized protein n=1 Tax=Riccia fluitans TaxID=41844 RepID=A0ABD1XLI7_9MARC